MSFGLLRQVNKGFDSELGNTGDNSRRSFFKITQINGSLYIDRGPSIRRDVIYVGIASVDCLLAMSVDEKIFVLHRVEVIGSRM